MGGCGEFLLKGGFHGNPGTSLDPPLHRGIKGAELRALPVKLYLPKPRTSIQLRKELGIGYACGYFFNCSHRVELTFNGLVEVMRVDTDSKFSIWFDNGHHGVDPVGRLLGTLDNSQSLHSS